MKINSKSAFTIAELIITCIMVGIILVIAPMVTLKRAVKPAVAKKFDFIAICARSKNDTTNDTVKCIFDAHSAILKDKNGEHARLDYNKNSNEFYTIELVGGGGGGTENSFGFPGESKVVFLPSLNNNQEVTNSSNAEDTNTFGGILTGYYLMEAGKGGESGQTGSPSRICIIKKDEAKNDPASLSCDNKTIIASAKGGITSKENAKFFGELESEKEQRQAIMATLTRDQKDAISYGWGGTHKGGAGNGGAIIIK